MPINQDACRRWATIGLASFVALLCLRPLQAEVVLPAVFGSDMVLQAGVPISIWGRAGAYEEIQVLLDERARSTTANAEGEWSVTYPATSADGLAHSILIRASNEIRLTNVSVGEVWYCSGQSNMEWPLERTAQADLEVTNAKLPQLRLFYWRGAVRGGSGEYTSEQLERLTPEKFCAGKWTTCSPDTAAEFSAVAYFFGRRLHSELDVPIGLICTAIGGTPTEAWIPRNALQSHPDTSSLVAGNWLANKALGEWCRDRAKSNFKNAIEAGNTIPGDESGPNHSFKPSFMYESAVRPFARFPLRGVLWYQGESNAESPRRVAQHKKLFPLLVHSWRRTWNLGDLPFLTVQLPAMRRPDWPAFRDQQRRFLNEIPNLGMTITIDVGHPTNVHPADKKTVGQRLANWALANTYERPDIAASGPLVSDCRIENARLTIAFDHAEGGLETADGTTPRGFELQDGNGRWYPLQVTIQGSRLIAPIISVTDPRSVRYGWEPFPHPPLNLTNSSGLPASPFEMRLETGSASHSK